MKNSLFITISAILTTTVLTVGTIGSIARAESEDVTKPTAPSPTIEVTQINGRDVAQLLATVCSSSSWEVFGTWAKTSGFLNRDFSESVHLESLSDGIRMVDTGLEVHAVREKGLNKLEITAQVDGEIRHVYKDADPCQMFTQYQLETKPEDGKELARLGEFALLASLSGGLLNRSVSADFSEWGYIDASFYLGSSNQFRSESTMNYSKLVSSTLMPPEIKCSPSVVTVTTDIQKLVAHQSNQTKIESFDRLNSTSNHPDGNSLYWQNTVKFMKTVKRICKSKYDARIVSHKTDLSLEIARARVTSIEQGSERVPSSTQSPE